MNSNNRSLRVLLGTLLLLVVGFALLLRAAYSTNETGRPVSLDQVYRFALDGEITSARLLDQDAQVVGQRCVPPEAPTEDQAQTEATAPDQAASTGPSCSGGLEAFRATYPRSDVSTQDLIERIAASGGTVTVDKQTAKGVARLIANFVFPLLILANLFGIMFVSRGGESSIAGVIGFGRMGRNRERQRRSGTGLTFADVAGVEEASAELREVIDYLNDPGRFEAYGAAPPKGVLLFGPPGCGKTLLAKATAGESGVPFFSVSGTEFVESLVGVGAARVRDLFAQVREVAPAIVFIDEIDAVGRRRSGEGSSGGEREQTLNQLLVEMDGFETSTGVVLMGATNRPDILDAALMRPGRFDRHITLEPPDVSGRHSILQVHARTKPLGEDVDLEALARRTPGFTGADLANVVNEGALLAIREGAKLIQARHLSEAVLRVLHGPQRRGKLLSPEERRRIAVHEAGHTVVAAATGRKNQRVSIVARGRGLGQSMLTSDGERVLLTASDLTARLAIASAGRAAEVLCLGETSTTSEDDIEVATGVAREMVGRYGMSAQLGGMRLLSATNGYLSSEMSMEGASAATMQAFDEEVRRLLADADQTARDLLERHRSDLDRVAAALEEHETLEGALLDGLLAGVRHEPILAADGPRKPPRRKPAAATKPPVEP